jgi:hypothetical protein
VTMEATNLGKVAARDNVRWLIVNTALETSGAPVHKLMSKAC